ncbi:hypothetical protein Pure05_21750 [Paenarthrobacter ureafaciens]|nr:hypothetical protein Pure01_21770 [Paenarthrobacter ureafaciens]GLU64081.1 hypothetical protein Pure02_23310 [Paenarthrobacter ureafaciens]GLU68357.1 hypothetical protein Pure03_23330 [Paenarthrobacter ureafaciens]GLU76735.1 hypothetical protein Pure05_21750 [Paenarthrobacter ureafaciens]
MQVQGLRLVLVQFLAEPFMFARRSAEDFGQRPGGSHDHAGHLREQGKSGGLLGKKTQLHDASGSGRMGSGLLDVMLPFPS